MNRFLGNGSGRRELARVGAVLVVGAALALGPWSCATDVVPVMAPTRIRLFNAGIGAPACYLNMTGAATGDTVGYGLTGRYSTVTNATQYIQARSSSGSLVAKIDGPPVILSPQDYTVILAGGANSTPLTVLLATDNHQNALPGLAYIKEFHLAANITSGVRVFIDGSDNGQHEQYDVDFAYDRIPAGTHVFRFASAVDTSVTYATNSFNLKQGYRYTIALTGVRLSSPALSLVASADSADGAAADRLSGPLVFHNPLR